MKFSIVTVCWNSEKVLPKALASLHAQRCTDYEWVVVDGGSTDRTLDIVRSFAGAPLNYISEPDHGIYNAMNKGARMARGEFVFFLNSDDALHNSEVLADVAAHLENNPNIDMLYGNVIYEHPGKRTLRTFSHIGARTLPFEDLCHQAVFARRTLFESVGQFDEKFRLNADYDWLIRVFRSGARCEWFDRVVALFFVGGAHTVNPAQLVTERKAVRLQYMSDSKLLVGEFLRRVRHRLHLHFRSHPLGQIPLKQAGTSRRVILLPHGFQPEYEVGFANGLVRNGWSVTLIGSDMSMANRLDPAVTLLNLRGSQNANRPRWAKAANMVRYWMRCYAHILHHRGTPVHMIGTFSTGDLRVSLLEAWLTRLMAGPFVMTVHNLLPHDRHSVRNAYLSRVIYRTASNCVVHTQRMRDALIADYGVEASRITVVEHGIDRLLPATPESRMAMRQQLHIEADESLLLFFGNLAPYKGVDLLLKAIGHLPPNQRIQLVIAGRCRDPKLRSALREQIEAILQRNQVQWLDGYVPEEDVPAIFHAADLLVMPYRHIDQSGVVFMALATGLRIVASDVGSLRDYIAPGMGLVVPPGDERDLAAGISAALTQLPTSAGPDTLAVRYLWSNTVQSLLPVYAWLSREADQ